MPLTVENMQSTSLEAWDAWRGQPSNYLDGLILRVLHEAGPRGLMCWQIEERLGRSHQAVSGNLRHIVERGGAFRLDAKGVTPSGRAAYYWAHVAFADGHLRGVSVPAGSPGK